MNEQRDKTFEKLAKAVEQINHSPGKIFWRGFLFGLGRGIGSIIGWLILIALLFWLVKVSGIADALQSLIQTFNDFSSQVENIPGFGPR